MTSIIQTVTNDKPIVSIISESHEIYLSVDGKNVYDIGYGCGTCPFLFNRQLSFKPDLNADEITEILKNGLSDLDEKVISSFLGLLAADTYTIGLVKIIPQYHAPKFSEKEKSRMQSLGGFYGAILTEFYEGRFWKIDSKGFINEVILPLTGTKYLNPETVKMYKEKLLNGETPTAVAFSYVESRHPVAFDSMTLPDNGCLAHFIMDGHHKIHAAAVTKRPITILSFLSQKHSGIIEYHREEREQEMMVILAKNLFNSGSTEEVINSNSIAIELKDEQVRENNIEEDVPSDISPDEFSRSDPQTFFAELKKLFHVVYTAFCVIFALLFALAFLWEILSHISVSLYYPHVPLP